MDSSKLVNWKLLNGILADANTTIYFADMSDAMITGPCAFSSCNVNNSVFSLNVLGQISVTNCKGGIIMYFDTTESGDPTIFQSSDLSGSMFVLPEEPCQPFLGAGLNKFNGSVFTKLIENENSVSLDLCGTSSVVTDNSFNSCQFNGVMLNFLDPLAVVTGNSFDSSTFTKGGFTFELEVDTFNTNTFKSCTFDGSYIYIYDIVDGGSFDFTGTKFSECTLELFKNQLIESCQFFNCIGADSSVESLVANAKKIGRAYDFQFNNKTYAVPAV